MYIFHRDGALKGDLRITIKKSLLGVKE
jgi:hypothetical protein